LTNRQIIMADEQIIKFNLYRALCLKNARDSVRAADLFIGKGVNHLCYHLYVHALEEIGKIFIAYYLMTRQETWDRPLTNIPMDDHVKKLFYAIWAPSISKEIITGDQIELNRGMASLLHARRVGALYTEFNDTIPSSEKVPDEEIESLSKFAASRLNLEEVHGDVNPDATLSESMVWFMEISNEPEIRNFIFGKISQEKLIELGNIFDWVDWLQKYFLEQEKENEEITKKELDRIIPKSQKKITKKWKIRIKISSSSHAIRPKSLQIFNKRNKLIQLTRSDQHTLLIDLTLGSNISVNELWSQGFLISKLFVAALNIGTNGMFFWNTILDTEKFYEHAHDIENDKKLELRLISGLKLNWADRNMHLKEEELNITEMLFNYFLAIQDRRIAECVNEFIITLGLMAKNDIHFRFETEIFMRLFKIFKSLVLTNYKQKDDISWQDYAFSDREQMLRERTQYEKILRIAESCK